MTLEQPTQIEVERDQLTSQLKDIFLQLMDEKITYDDFDIRSSGIIETQKVLTEQETNPQPHPPLSA